MAQQQIMGIWLKVKGLLLKQGFAWLIYRSRTDSDARQAAKRPGSTLLGEVVCVGETGFNPDPR